MTITRLLGRCLLLAALATGADAAQLARPTGPVLLTVEGAIGVTNADGRAEFDRAMLEGLRQRVTSTGTPWSEGVSEFRGPLGRALLEAVGATGELMVIRALNDYAMEVPVADFHRHDVILAMQRDGRALRVRDKGPLFVIYPFDEHPELDNEVFHSRSVWQVKSIEVR